MRTRVVSSSIKPFYKQSEDLCFVAHFHLAVARTSTSHIVYRSST